MLRTIAAITGGTLCLLGLASVLLPMFRLANTPRPLSMQVEVNWNEQPPSQIEPEIGEIIQSPRQQEETSSSYWTESEMMEALPYPMPAPPEKTAPYPIPTGSEEENIIPDFHSGESH